MSDNLKKDIKKFAMIEKELSLFDRQYNGFYYWSYVRFSICESLFVNKSQVNSNNKSKDINNVNKNYVLIFFRGIFEAIRLKKYLFFKNKCDIVYLKYGSLSNKFFDTWDIPSNVSAINFRLVPFTEGYNKGDYFIEWPRIKSGILNILFNFFGIHKVDLVEKAFLSKLVKRLIDEFGQCYSVNEIETLIHRSIIKEQCFSKVYERIFKSLNCKVIVFECYYHGNIIPAIKVAKKLGVLVVELQHGVVINHECYWFEDDRGVNNYVPDIFLTFGKFHSHVIKLVKGTKIVEIGYPYQEKIISNLDISTNNKEIVIYPVSDYRFENVVDNFVNEVVKFGYKVFLKVHPNEIMNYNELYPVLSNNKNLNIVDDQNKSIYYWLKRARHHIMASTTVGLESIVFDNLNVCVATNVPHEQVQCLIDWGIARGFCNLKELLFLIKNPIEINLQHLKYVRNEMWKQNASKNMTNYFKQLISK